jgi:hypothetical protein
MTLLMAMFASRVAPTMPRWVRASGSWRWPRLPAASGRSSSIHDAFVDRQSTCVCCTLASSNPLYLRAPPTRAHITVSPRKKQSSTEIEAADSPTHGIRVWSLHYLITVHTAAVCSFSMVESQQSMHLRLLLHSFVRRSRRCFCRRH